MTEKFLITNINNEVNLIDTEEDNLILFERLKKRKIIKKKKKKKKKLKNQLKIIFQQNQ